MNLNELIAECERLDKEATPGPWKDDHVGNVRADDLRIMPQTYNDSHFFARSRTLLPLLVKVIKNQQRQIEQLDEAVGDLVDADSQSYRTELVRSLYSLLKSIAAELEDVKPC